MENNQTSLFQSPINNINGLLEKFKSNPEPSSLTKQNDPINEEDDYFDRGDYHSDFN